MTELIGLYARHQRRKGLARSTIELRDRQLRRFHQAVGAWEVDTERIERFLDNLGPITPKYRYGWTSTLGCFYSWAVRAGHLISDPTVDLVRPKLRRYLPRPIGADDLRVAVELAEPMMRAWLLLGAFSGLRCMEIAKLERDCVNDTDDPPMLRVLGKGDRERMVPLHPAVLDAMRPVMARRGRVFQQPGGCGFSPGHVSRRIGSYLRSIGIEATAHMLRHGFATSVYRCTRDLRTTQELLGHASPSVTAVYVAWDRSEGVRAVESLSL